MDTINNGNTAAQFQMGGADRKIEEAEHEVRMHEVAEANVEVFAGGGTPAFHVTKENQAEVTPEDRIHDTLALTAGGSQEYREIMAMCAYHAESDLVKSYNSAINEALNGDSAVKRHNGLSKAESLIGQLKRSRQALIDKANPNSGPDIAIIG